MDPCPECLGFVGKDGQPLELIRFRLVRDARGKCWPWGTGGKTLAPSLFLCVRCIARFPLHDPLDPDEAFDLELPYGTRGAVWTSAPSSPGTQAVFDAAVAALNPREAVYGWPSSASCYLVTETLVRRLAPRAWKLLQQSAATQQAVEERIQWWRRALQFLRKKFI